MLSALISPCSSIERSVSAVQRLRRVLGEPLGVARDRSRDGHRRRAPVDRASPGRTPGTADRGRSACRSSEIRLRGMRFAGFIDQACRPASSRDADPGPLHRQPGEVVGVLPVLQVLQHQHEVGRVRPPSARRRRVACPSEHGRRHRGRTPARAGTRRASPWRRGPRTAPGSLTITVGGRPGSPLSCSRYSSDEKPLSWAICSARTAVTAACPAGSSARSASVSHSGVDGVDAGRHRTRRWTSPRPPTGYLTLNN